MRNPIVNATRLPAISRRTVLVGLSLSAAGVFASRTIPPTQTATAAPATPAASPVPDVSADAVIAVVYAAMSQYHLKAAIARVVIDDQELVTIARGETMNGVPATPEMHFRNGAVAISYMSTALLILVDQGVVGLDDVLATWLPDLPDADTTTLRMLANMTAGYPDYVNTDEFAAASASDPFRRWPPEDLIAMSLVQGRTFAPGENWAYSHSDYVILGLALEQITGSRWMSSCASWCWWSTRLASIRRRSRSRCCTRLPQSAASR